MVTNEELKAELEKRYLRDENKIIRLQQERIKELERDNEVYQADFGNVTILQAKRDLAQQAKGVVWCLEEFCTTANDDAKKTMRDRLEQLRQKAEDL